MAQHLNNHNPESSSSRADKMSGYIREQRKFWGQSKTSDPKRKKFYQRKRRMFLKNPSNWEKI